jgi:hypothetical protein
MGGVDINKIPHDRPYIDFMLDIQQPNVLVTNSYMAHTPSESYMTMTSEVNASHPYSMVPYT